MSFSRTRGWVGDEITVYRVLHAVRRFIALSRFVRSFVYCVPPPRRHDDSPGASRARPVRRRRRGLRIERKKKRAFFFPFDKKNTSEILKTKNIVQHDILIKNSYRNGFLIVVVNRSARVCAVKHGV